MKRACEVKVGDFYNGFCSGWLRVVSVRRVFGVKDLVEIELSNGGEIQKAFDDFVPEIL